MSTTTAKPPYDPNNMDQAIAYTKQIKRVFRSGDVQAAYALYMADPNGGAHSDFRNTTLKEFAANFHKLSGGHDAITYMSPAERQAWSESGATDDEMDALTRAGGYAKISQSRALTEQHQDILHRAFEKRLQNVKDALKEKGWFHPSGNTGILSLLQTRSTPDQDVMLSISTDYTPRYSGEDKSKIEGLVYDVFPEVGAGVNCREFHFFSFRDQMLFSADHIANVLTDVMAYADELRVRAQQPQAQKERLVELSPDQWRAEYQGSGCERSIEAGKTLITGIVERLGGKLDRWDRSMSSLNWELSEAEIDGERFRVACSSGGVVQVNGDPFSPFPEREMNTNSNAIMRSTMAVLPQPVALKRLATLLSEQIDDEIKKVYSEHTGAKPVYADVFDWLSSNPTSESKTSIALVDIAVKRGLIGTNQHSSLRENIIAEADANRKADRIVYVQEWSHDLVKRLDETCVEQGISGEQRAVFFQRIADAENLSALRGGDSALDTTVAVAFRFDSAEEFSRHCAAGKQQASLAPDL